jgi:hypothetical protein
MSLLDARGVEIEPGDVCLYGFGVGRSVAMAEAVVLGAHADHKACQPPCLDEVSLTPSGRVRLRVIRRSYASGEKPVVDVAPDRLVVLKPSLRSPATVILPPSPLPTQDEEARAEIEKAMAWHTAGLRATVAPAYWGQDMPDASPEIILANYHAYCVKQLGIHRKRLRALDDQA